MDLFCVRLCLVSAQRLLRDYSIYEVFEYQRVCSYHEWISSNEFTLFALLSLSWKQINDIKFSLLLSFWRKILSFMRLVNNKHARRFKMNQFRMFASLLLLLNAIDISLSVFTLANHQWFIGSGEYFTPSHFLNPQFVFGGPTLIWFK